MGTTQKFGEEDFPVTSDAIGEEDSTMSIGEEDTTQAIGEEDVTTDALGEEGPIIEDPVAISAFGGF
ncbi:MAG TPA: hypothetical protein VF665_02350 [Longimicrobium sp.]|jgi:hypothetical protein|uniref:hypothetical protein n=1 Tax=Longimicrobium sp. TaxID=2029185 RepID=UPI002ED7DB5D